MRSPERPIRSLLVALAFVALLFATTFPGATASVVDLDFHDCAFAKGPGNGECQHFLHNPLGVTDDPCWCDKCRNGVTGEHHDGKTIPEGWSPTLFESSSLECYLKRHALAWGITCSECLANDKAWPDGGGSAGPLGTVPEKDYGGQPAKKTIDTRLAVEKRLFKKPDDVILAYDRHFYMVTDIEPLKVKTPGGGARLMSRHEWAHLMIERAEFARREWVRNFGEPTSRKPVALFFPEKERDLLRIGAEYFRIPGAKGIRGGGGDLCDQMCLTAVAFSHEKQGDDQSLQVGLRHMLSRNYLSIYAAQPTRPKSLPVWLDEGLAHWLVKTRFPDEATYDVSEGSGAANGGGASGKSTGIPSYSGKDWEKDLVKYVQGGKVGVIEELLGKLDFAQLTEEDQKRSWSICALCLAEWREPFVKVVRALRQEKDVREAFTKNFGCTPEEFDERWKERILGRRKSMASAAGDEESDEATGARDRRSLQAETSPQTLAAKLHAFGEIKDRKTIPVVLDTIAKGSDLVRETAFVTLLKTKDKDCLETLWTYGLAHLDGIVRAYAAKLCGRLRLAAALPKLEAQMEDKNWYARAEAAIACGELRDVKAMAGIRKIVDSDPSEKAQVGALDAIALFREDAQSSVPTVAKQLDSAQWQLRVAAAQTLGQIGQMEGVEPLIARMEKETGRVQDEIHEALKKIARDDLGRKAANWRKWWEEEKTNSPSGLPARPPVDAAPKGTDPNDPHATHDATAPLSFGVELYSNRVAFVVDATETMLTLFTPDPSSAHALSREYVGRNKLEICKEEIAQALAQLDPRAHFNIIAFGMQIRAFKDAPVPASKGNIEEAVGFLKSIAGAGRTNYYGALKAALDVGAAPDANPNFNATPDTITFLTDGIPNEGDIIDADTLVEWYTGLNRYARVKTFTIAFGVVGVDMPLLKGLAVRNGGRFTLVAEKKAEEK